MRLSCPWADLSIPAWFDWRPCVESLEGAPTGFQSQLGSIGAREPRSLDPLAERFQSQLGSIGAITWMGQ